MTTRNIRDFYKLQGDREERARHDFETRAARDYQAQGMTRTEALKVARKAYTAAKVRS